MSAVAGWRTALAAGTALAMLAGAYEAAKRFEESRQFEAREAARFERLHQKMARADSAAAVATPAGQPDGEALLDTAGTAAAARVAAQLAAEEAERRAALQKIPADTTIRFASDDPLAYYIPCPTHAYRYVGTLGGQAVVLWLAAGDAGDTIATGSWYYRTTRQPHERNLASWQRRDGYVVFREEIPTNTPTDADTVAAEWQLPWPPRRAFTAQRRERYGPGQQVVPLHQDYSQAVPYELPRLTIRGSYCHEEPGRPQPCYSTNFLHLLGANSRHLARWQAPSPAGRRDSLRRWLQQDGGCAQLNNSLSVTLDDYGLLSYSVWEYADYYGNHPGNEQSGRIIDLHAGREWRIQQLLQPGTEPALLKLLARHLRHDYADLNEGDNWHWQTVPPLPDAFTLTPIGLYAGYSDYALTAYVNHYANNTTIPYPELRPLVRPGTPLARMLRARGLW